MGTDETKEERAARLKRRYEDLWQGGAKSPSPTREEGCAKLAERLHKLVDALEAIAMMRSKDECQLAAEMRNIALGALTSQSTKATKSNQ